MDESEPDGDVEAEVHGVQTSYGSRRRAYRIETTTTTTTIAAAHIPSSEAVTPGQAQERLGHRRVVQRA